MANNCTLAIGYSYTCAEKKLSVGGLRTTVYLFNTADLDSYSVNGNGEVDSLSFTGYTGMYKFVGRRLGNRLVDDLARTEGGNVYYPTELTLQMIDVTQAHRDFYESIAQAEAVGAVIETAKGVFELVGYEVGLELTTAPRDTGTPQSDTARLLTLSGDETAPPKIVSMGSNILTSQALESYLV